MKRIILSISVILCLLCSLCGCEKNGGESNSVSEAESVLSENEKSEEDETFSKEILDKYENIFSEVILDYHISTLTQRHNKVYVCVYDPEGENGGRLEKLKEYAKEKGISEKAVIYEVSVTQRVDT